MSEANPLRIFVTHTFSDHADYQRVFEYLESASNFFYTNCSDPEAMPASGGKDAIRNTLLKQIRNAEIVIVVSSLYADNPSLLNYQMDAAQAANLPLIALEPFGGAGSVPDEISSRAAAVVGWNDRSIVDAIMLEARHEDTKRWDVIEFEMP